MRVSKRAAHEAKPAEFLSESQTFAWSFIFSSDVISDPGRVSRRESYVVLITSSNMPVATRNAMAMALSAGECADGSRGDLLERHGTTTRANVKRALNKS